MRNAEWINLLFFSFFLLVSLFRPFTKQTRRIKAIAIGVCGIVLVLSAQTLHVRYASIIRDWLPAPLMLFAYWQAGNLFRSPNEKLQNLLINFDRKVFARFHFLKTGAWVSGYLEFTYLLCYPLVPLGLAVLYFMRMEDQSDLYWSAILIPTYFCHAMVPFTQTLPPWMLEPENNRSPRTNTIRAFNFWIIKYASIHANTLPSAHVTASIAASLILLQSRALAGFIFLWIAISIAVAAVAGRYHYSLDVIAATIVVLIVFGILQM